MLTNEAKQTLRRIAKAMRPATPPWNTDETVLDEWTAAILARNLENADIHQLFDKWTTDGNTRWPSLYQFRELAKRRPHKQTEVITSLCTNCYGNGWTYQHNADGTEETMQRHGHTYTFVTPCRCSAGQQVEQSDLYKQLKNAQQ